MRKLIHFSFLVLCSALVVGCSSTSLPEPAVAEISAEQSPVEIKIAKETNDGHSLTVELLVVAKAAWPANDIVIELTGIRNGEEISQTKSPLGSGQMLAIGQELPLTVSVKGDDLSDYRLDCVWGTHQSNTPETAPNYDGMLRDLTVAIESQDCPASACPSSYVVTGEIFNKTEISLSRVVLNVDYEVLKGYQTQPAEAAQSAQPASELELPKLSLPPGASQKIRVVFDPLPAEQLAILRPRLQVKSAE